MGHAMTHPGLPLAIALLAAPFVAVLQSKAMAPLALIPMAITLGLGWRAGWRPSLPQGPLLLLGLLLAAWGAITALWAPEPGRAALLAVTLAAMMLLAHGAAGAAQGARLLPWIGFGLVFGLAVRRTLRMIGYSSRGSAPPASGTTSSSSSTRPRPN